MRSAAPIIPPLTRNARARTRIVPRLVWAATSALLALKLLTSGSPGLDCRTASATAPAKLAATVCEREYLQSAAPEIGARLADAERRRGNVAVAGALANGLLVTSARADALWVIGMIAAAEDQHDTARRAFESARALHRAEHRDGAAARDERALADLAARSPIESPVRI